MNTSSHYSAVIERSESFVIEFGADNNKESGLRYRVYHCNRARRMECCRGVWELGLVTTLVLVQGIKGYKVYSQVVAIMAKV